MDDASDLGDCLEGLSLEVPSSSAAAEEGRVGEEKNEKEKEKAERARLKEEQRKEFWKEKRKRQKEKRKERGAPRKKRYQDPIQPLQKPVVVIDMSWGDLQTTKEMRSLANQVLHIYGAHRRAPKPLELHLTSVQGGIRQALANHEGYEKWELAIHSEHVLEVFAKEVEEVVYFSPDAEEVCGELEEGKVYVIGGIVDRDRLKGVTWKASKEREVRAVRLPINECGVLEEGERFPNKSLNVNTMYQVLLGYSEHGNWRDALRPLLPTRRGFHTQGGKEKEKEKEKEGDEEEKGEEEEGEEKEEEKLPNNL